MVNKITVEISKKQNRSLELFQESPESNCFELIFEDGEELSIEELKALNKAGYVYHSSQIDIQFEDEVFGAPYMRTMDIHYFAKVDSSVFENCMPA